MGKKNRKQIREEKEEQQGKKVMITMLIHNGDKICQEGMSWRKRLNANS